jgi:hypothetical protein
LKIDMARHLLADSGRASRLSNRPQRAEAQRVALALAPEVPLIRGYRAALILLTRGERPRDSAVVSMARSLETARAVYSAAVNRNI